MKKEIRTVCYDDDLRLEAYRFEGIVQSFPNHFHNYYVIGFIESGTHCLSCKNKEYTVGQGNILLFNPNDNHSCVQCDGEAFDYRGLNISKETMLSLVEEVTGQRELLGFSENVIKNDELNIYLHSLHQSIMEGSKEFEKEEMLLLLISLLIEQYGQPYEGCIPECREEIERTCVFMSAHFAEHISLENLCKCSGLSKSTLLRAFTRSKGVTPYRYLQIVRIDKAKEMLEQGVPLVDAAIRTGFSDQSHFSNFFHMFIGLSPAAYRRIFKEGGKNHG
ncbi:helix-turn-helix domain-containing protein [Lachnospiraceae bacterium WCA-9-b2]|uniref:Helix-turn-helix domain-containing protein n=1 Tax=Sporofaciens musculi TaxID=2681861 RepID=A0A7X3MCY5_9FIRM|nr:AraC family transcriptional regulator [Sporofaciens musculi]MCI9423230.1 AraC family transcriptional regulator [Dorea sp.]MXP74134.1 helix-turn-helix domain-containing protein [Sporofaciens musculi]